MEFLSFGWTLSPASPLRIQDIRDTLNFSVCGILPTKEQNPSQPIKAVHLLQGGEGLLQVWVLGVGRGSRV